jgi:hypothetical protein
MFCISTGEPAIEWRGKWVRTKKVGEERRDKTA